uniref:Ribosomal protein n=1 Tax=Xenopsylla cheopis TaxID=163159 RepID=A0A6M2DD30_XENCH
MTKTIINPLYQNNALLQPKVPAIVIPNCGMKVKGRLRRRCKDCYFVTRDERLYVMCKSQGRHKQMSMKKKEYNLWMLSHATQSKYREW